MCKNCGNCRIEHESRSMDDEIYKVIDNPAL